MLTRFVRIQLIIFTIASIVGLVVMVFNYVQAPMLLGLGRITVTLELPTTGGLYRFSNVTYRGVQIGKVTDVHPVRDGAVATLSLDSSSRIPADLVAAVHSVSAIGEQYVDLQPRTRSGPYLHDGSVIARGDTTIPQAVGPMLDKVSALVDSIPGDRISDLLDESFKAFDGAGYDVSSLVDSAANVSADLNGVGDQLATAFDDAQPLLDSQIDSADATRVWIRSLAATTGQLVKNDPQLRKLLQVGPGALDEVSRLLDQVKPTLPVLLANLVSIGQVGVIYHPSLEQLLVVLPPLVAFTQAASAGNNPSGMPLGDFRLSGGDAPGCTVGFLPPSAWRNPADETTIDTPDGLYCKLPQDSPILVRGSRNLPCMGVPGKRAPTVQECYSDKPFQPLAMREHALGPYPLDPNLVAQGIPPDWRVNSDDKIFAPVEGTPLPPGVPAAAGSPADVLPQTPSEPAPPAPTEPAVAPPAPGPAPGAAPSAFDRAEGDTGPSVAITRYDPRTGRYATPGGQVFAQTDLVNGPPKSWHELVMPVVP